MPLNYLIKKPMVISSNIGAQDKGNFGFGIFIPNFVVTMQRNEA
jgi:hypothetical protein